MPVPSASKEPSTEKATAGIMPAGEVAASPGHMRLAVDRRQQMEGALFGRNTQLVMLRHGHDTCTVAIEGSLRIRMQRGPGCGRLAG